MNALPRQRHIFVREIRHRNGIDLAVSVLERVAVRIFSAHHRLLQCLALSHLLLGLLRLACADLKLLLLSLQLHQIGKRLHPLIRIGGLDVCRDGRAEIWRHELSP
ncbi:hypothetical protein CFB41_17000 [Burkholderia sp. AU33803]|nr:hypothetical protein CFB41_17000 [Burkholderia sp. AU33803]